MNFIQQKLAEQENKGKKNKIASQKSIKGQKPSKNIKRVQAK